jgi:hypothetical protein
MAYAVAPSGRAEYLHYSPADGHAYGMPAPRAVLARAERMRAAFLAELRARRELGA